MGSHIGKRLPRATWSGFDRRNRQNARVRKYTLLEKGVVRVSGAVSSDHLLIFIWRQSWKAFMDPFHGIVNIGSRVYF